MSDGSFPRPPRAYPSRAPDDADRNAPSSDPLLELARLIGQSDPFGPPTARSGDSPRGMPDLPTRGPMARPPSREVSSAPPDRYAAEREREAPPARSHPFPSLQTFPSRSFAADDRVPQDRVTQDRVPQDRVAQDRVPQDRVPQDRGYDDRGDDGYSEPARAEAAPAAPARFEFPERGFPERDFPELGGPAPGRTTHDHSAYPDETHPTVPDQHYPAEPEPAYREDDLPASGECTAGGFAPRGHLPATGRA